MDDPKKKAIVLSSSTRMEHKLRTPLQAAAFTGDMAIFGALLGAFDSIFARNGNSNSLGDGGRKWEMKRQLEIVDGADMNLLMHSAAGGTSAVFKAVAQEIQPSQARRILRDKDEKGMTFLMHAANCGSDRLATSPTAAEEVHRPQQWEGALGGTVGDAPSIQTTTQNAPTPAVPQSDGNQQSNERRLGKAAPLDPWVPVVVSTLEFARKTLWRADYRQLLETRDAWKRSIIEHSVASGRKQVFEAVFDAIRNDIHDDKVSYMMNTGVDSSEAQNAINMSLQSTGGRKITPLVSEKSKSLERDVSLRAEASTVSAKIQAFIPANLIVIFQLLLPEFEEESDGPLYLLIVLCAIAPFWAWGSNMVSTKNPERVNTSARETAARYFLAIPATFFWGTGTSKIGTYSFNWEESVSAAALAVATIVIPALDSFFSGSGARTTIAMITLAMLDSWEWLKKICSSCGEEQQLAHEGGVNRPNTRSNHRQQEDQEVDDQGAGLPVPHPSERKHASRIGTNSTTQPGPDMDDDGSN